MAGEQISFSEIKRQTEVALDAGNLSKVESILLPLLRTDDRSRAAEDNLFVYRTLGKVYAEQGKAQEALTAYEQAHGYDVRDLDALNALVERELSKDSDADEALMQEMLVFHRDTLKPVQVARLFKNMGDARQKNGAHAQAREFYEKALDVRPGDMDLIDAMIKVSEASGDDAAVRAAREKLLDSMTAPESRAAVLVAIGDDYLNRDKDEQRALSLYEEALSECAQSTAAWGRILVIAERTQDWDRCMSALTALVDASQDDDEKCKYFLKMAWIYEEKLNNPTGAVECFNHALDLHPSQIEVFQRLLSILQTQKDFAGVDANFERMIGRQTRVQPPDIKLITALCQSLGKFRLEQLKDLAGAAKAYKAVSTYNPNNIQIHMILAKIYAQLEDKQAEAVFENREILRLSPDRLDAGLEIARCYRRMGKFDESLCVYRVLDVLNAADQEGKDIVQKFADTELPKLSERLNEEQLRLICPATLDTTLLRIMRIISPFISGCFTDDSEHYHINLKEARVDTSGDTVFVNALKNTASALGFEQIPNVYSYDKLSGINNAFFDERSFLVNPNFLGARSTRELVFAAAKAMFLMRPEFYLLSRGKTPQEKIAFTQNLILIALKTVNPRVNVQLEGDLAKISRVLNSALESKPESRKLLSDTVAAICEKGSNLNVQLFLESVEDYANRIALLFCDDPSVVANVLAEEGSSLSGRQIPARVGSLLFWALSEDYLKLRHLLKITIN